MRTLFLKGNKAKRRVWVGALMGVLLLCWHVVVGISVDWDMSDEAWVGLTALAGGVLLAGRWLYLRHVQNTTRNLKDSALW